MNNQVWPASGVARSFAEDLERLFPQVLVIFNECRATWQAYEVPKGSDWDAERLVNAIRAFHSAGEGSESDWTWWDGPLAPRVFEDALPMRPGDWFIQYLKQIDFWRTGGAKTFVRDKERREQERAEAGKRDRHRESRGKADDLRRTVIDQMPTGVSQTDALKEIRRREGRAEVTY